MIHWWQPMPPGEQGLRRQRLPTDGAKLGNWLTGSRDRYLLALGGSIDHLAAVVAQFADRDLSHIGTVSRVIQRRCDHHGASPRRSRVVVAGLDVERHHLGVGAGDRTPTARRLPVSLLAEQRLTEPVKLGNNLLRGRTHRLTGPFA